MIWINIALIGFNVCIAVCNFIISYHILKEGKKTIRELVQALDLIGVWCVALGSKDTKDVEEALINIDGIARKAIKIYERSRNDKNTY